MPFFNYKTVYHQERSRWNFSNFHYNYYQLAVYILKLNIAQLSFPRYHLLFRLKLSIIFQAIRKINLLFDFTFTTEYLFLVLFLQFLLFFNQLTFFKVSLLKRLFMHNYLTSCSKMNFFLIIFNFRSSFCRLLIFFK